MKKLLISLGLVAAMATPAAFAHTDLSIGIGLGSYYEPAPVYYEPAPRVYYDPYPYYYRPRVVYRSYYEPRYYRHDNGYHRGWHHDRDRDWDRDRRH